MHDLVTQHRDAVKVRAAFRSESKATAMQAQYRSEGDAFEACVGIDADSVAAVVKAFQGATCAVIVTPHDPSGSMEDDHRLSANMVHAAVEAGVQHIIYVGSWTVNVPAQLPILSSRFLPTEQLLAQLASQGAGPSLFLRFPLPPPQSPF